MSSNQTDMALFVSNINSISNTISYYYLWVIIPLGLIGNLISFYLYTRPNLNKRNNTGFLYACLCVLNMISILYYAFITRSSVLFGYSTFQQPCGLNSYFRRLVFNSIPWMQVIITFDRFISVFYPTIQFLNKKVG